MSTPGEDGNQPRDEVEERLERMRVRTAKRLLVTDSNPPGNVLLILLPHRGEGRPLLWPLDRQHAEALGLHLLDWVYAHGGEQHQRREGHNGRGETGGAEQ